MEVSREGSANALLEALERSHETSIMEPRSRLQIKLEQERIVKVTGEHHTNTGLTRGVIFAKFLAVWVCSLL